MPHKLSRFWQELKRRKVFRVIAMYAGAAYIIIELVNNVSAPLHLPEWTATLVILLLATGFPVVAILSWIFDFTPEGWMKTKPAKIHRGKKAPEAPPERAKRKLKVSDGIIIIMATVIILLAYPKIFKRSASLRDMTMPVTVINEFGEKETRRIFKEDFITRLAIFPFSNESKDSSANWLQYGIYEAVWDDLYQFDYLTVTGNEDAFSLQEQIKFCETNNYPHFLTGMFRVTGGDFEIISRICQTSNGTVKAERIFRGSDFFSLVDSISVQARADLDISGTILNSSPDLPFKAHVTDNLDAFRYFATGYYMDSLNNNLNRAIQLDSTSAVILWYRAQYNFNYQRSIETAVKDIDQAMRHRKRLSEPYEILIRIYYYLIHGENDKAVALAELQHELKPDNIQFLWYLIDTYQRTFRTEKLEKATRLLNEMVPGQPEYRIMLASSYLFSGKPDKGLKVLKKLLKDNPENTMALMQMGQLYLHKNDPEAAEKVFQKAILLSPDDQKYWSGILVHIDYIRNNPVSRNFLGSFTGHYRNDDDELVTEIFEHNKHLIWKAENQYAYYRYPVSPDQFISFNGFHTETFVIDGQGKVVKFIHEQRNIPGDSFIIWKEDSLVYRATELLNKGNNAEALTAFRVACEQNPEHDYLANYKRHLEFVQSMDYNRLQPALDSCSGDYEGLIIFMDNKQFYYQRRDGLIYKLLPLSESLFMIPGRYDCQIQIEKENGSVRGLKMIYRDGTEIYKQRIK